MTSDCATPRAFAVLRNRVRNGRDRNRLVRTMENSGFGMDFERGIGINLMYVVTMQSIAHIDT